MLYRLNLIGPWSFYFVLLVTAVAGAPVDLANNVKLGSSVDSAAAAAAAAAAAVMTPEVPWYYRIFSWQFIAATFLVLSPITSYGDTVYTIWRTKSCAGFSLDLCGIMLVSSILRVAFYFGEPYELSLLWQSILMIAIQIVLLALVLAYRQDPLPDSPSNVVAMSDYNKQFFRSASGGKSLLDIDPVNAQLSLGAGMARRKSVSEIIHNLRPAKSVSVLRPVPESNDNITSFSAQDISGRIVPLARKVSRAIRTSFISGSSSSTTSTAYPSFSSLLAYTPPGYGDRPFNLWQWTDDIVYWQFLFLLSLALFGAHLVLGTWCWTYIQLIGLVGLLIEAVLPLPQIITNAECQSVQGFRLSLLASWLAGDVSKLTYFRYGVTNTLAPQFIFCTLIRLVLDLFVGVQYVFYSIVLPATSSMRPVKSDGMAEVVELKPMKFPSTSDDFQANIMQAQQQPPYHDDLSEVDLQSTQDNLMTSQGPLLFTKTRQRSHSIKAATASSGLT